MRRRITSAIVGVTAFVLLALGIPLAIAAQRNIASSELVELQADSAAALTEIELPIDVAQLEAIASEPDAPLPFSVYDANGRLVFGDGPASPDAPTRAALAGVSTHSTDGDIVVASPITDAQENIVGVLRTVDSRGEVDSRTRSTWAVMALCGALALGLAWLLARRVARNLTAPIELLAVKAADLDNGVTRDELPPSGIREIDALADALIDSSTRTVEALARERRFSADVSHQLRTPLAGMRLKLERPATTDEAVELAAGVLDDLDRLDATVTHLLAFARDATPQSEPAPLTRVLERTRQRWSASIENADRHIEWHIATPQLINASATSVDQVLDVLLNNAIRHGSGDITVATRALPGAAAIDVADAGSLPDNVTEQRLFRHGDGDDHGIGLALARSLATADGGRLLLTSRKPTVFTLFLPASEPGRERVVPGAVDDSV